MNPLAIFRTKHSINIDELHQQYLLGFVPPARDGKEHKIEVRLRPSGLKARVRKAYRAPK